MSKRLEELSMDLAAGMSRRKALWRFLGGAGAAVLMAGKGRAAGNNVCVAWCRRLAEDAGQIGIGRDDIFGKCMSASAHCPKGQCAFLNITNGGQVTVAGCFPADEF
jgi:hypothetical protein